MESFTADDVNNHVTNVSLEYFTANNADSISFNRSTTITSSVIDNAINIDTIIEPSTSNNANESEGSDCELQDVVPMPITTRNLTFPNFTQSFTSTRRNVLTRHNLDAETHQYVLPEHVEYFIYEIRLASFKNWPINFKMRPEMLANVGFFMNPKDGVLMDDQKKCVCFQCGCEVVFRKDIACDLWYEHIVAALELREINGGILCNFVLSHLTLNFIRNVEYSLSLKLRCRRTISNKCRKTNRSFYYCNNCKLIYCANDSEKQQITSNHKFTGIVGCVRNLKKCPKFKNRIASFENKLLINESNKSLCKICYSKDIEITILPCAHTIACVKCSNDLVVCPICRIVIQKKVKLYFS